MAFTSHGLGPSYKARKGLACLYLQTATTLGEVVSEVDSEWTRPYWNARNLGPHGRGINYPGGWIPSKVRLDDGEWHAFELVKGVSGTMLSVDGKRMEANIKHHNRPNERSKFLMRLRSWPKSHAKCFLQPGVLEHLAKSEGKKPFATPAHLPRRPVSKILVGTAHKTGFNGDIKEVQIFTGGKRVYGSAPESRDLSESAPDTAKPSLEARRWRFL